MLSHQPTADVDLSSLIRSASKRGTEYLLSRRNEKGLIGRDIFALCTVPLALYEAGFEEEAHTQLSAIQREFLRDGKIIPEYLRDRIISRNFVCYYLSLLALASAKLKDEEGLHALGDSMLEYQDSTFGGFYLVHDPPERSEMHATITSLCGTVCLRLGQKEKATMAGEFIIRLLNLQHDPDLFSYRTNIKGQLIQDSYLVDRRKTRQRYAVLGKMIWFLVNLHRATGNPSYLEGAERIFIFADSCRKDIYHRFSSAMLASGAALLHNMTGNPRHSSMANAIAESLAKHQHSDGSWPIGWIINELDRPISVTDCIKAVSHRESWNVDRTSEAVIALSGVLEASNMRKLEERNQ